MVWSLRKSASKSATPHESSVCLYLSSVQPLTELTSETLVLSLLLLPLSSLYTHEVKYISLLSQQSSYIRQWTPAPQRLAAAGRLRSECEYKSRF